GHQRQLVRPLRPAVGRPPDHAAHLQHGPHWRRRGLGRGPRPGDPGPLSADDPAGVSRRLRFPRGASQAPGVPHPAGAPRRRAPGGLAAGRHPLPGRRDQLPRSPGYRAPALRRRAGPGPGRTRRAAGRRADLPSARWRLDDRGGRNHGSGSTDRRLRMTEAERSTSKNTPESWTPWMGFGPWQAAWEYWTDAMQRSVLFWDVMRKRGNMYLEHEAKGKPPVLVFEHEMVLDGRTLERPVNYFLVRIVPPAGMRVDPKKRPFVVFDPRAGHGPGIGGFKVDSE